MNRGEMIVKVGIEAINAYGCSAFINVETIFDERGLDKNRMGNLMMEKKAIGLPCEDAVTNAVNAAKPIIDQLSQSEIDDIELLITTTESGVDFGKSLSTYIHDYLGISKHCRLFELKQACYAGTAGLQMAAHFVAANAMGKKALVIATDTARGVAMTYAEPSQGAGAVAMLVGRDCKILQLDLNASGIYSYEVMDTCRPEPEVETGDPDLSLLSYLDCLSGAYENYVSKVKDVDILKSFSYFAFHTPFGGMVKGAHRKLIRENSRLMPNEISNDFEARVYPSLKYCVKVGNIYGGTVYLALCSLIDNAVLDGPKRVGLYSYGSGCSSEFFSGVITPKSQQLLGKMQIGKSLDSRFELSMAEYEKIIALNDKWIFGVKDRDVDITPYANIYEQKFAGKKLLRLKKVNNYHREYEWS